jgi:serine/threonine protein kinase
MEVAQGLHYLHHECHSPIVHCDIKPSNILFNFDMEARISDFGLAKIVVDLVSSTQNLKGTFGYIAPGMVFFSKTCHVHVCMCIWAFA